jgi:four helix bundle protein
MKDFRKIKAYNLAFDLAVDLLKVMDTFPAEKDGEIQRQLCESGTKIAAKIAGGCGWGTKKGMLRMLMVAAGNAQMFDSALTIAHRRGLLDEATYGRLVSKLIDVRDELDSMIDNFSPGERTDD